MSDLENMNAEATKEALELFEKRLQALESENEGLKFQVTTLMSEVEQVKQQYFRVLAKNFNGGATS